jgi:hypothetical protein
MGGIGEGEVREIGGGKLVGFTGAGRDGVWVGFGRGPYIPWLGRVAFLALGYERIASRA